MRDGRKATFGTAGRSRFLAHFTLDRVHSEIGGLYQRLVAQSTSEAALQVARSSGLRKRPSHA